MHNLKQELGIAKYVLKLVIYVTYKNKQQNDNVQATEC